MSRQGRVSPSAAIDACCLIDLLASGETEAILRASGLAWHLPSAVRDEVRYRRQHDPAQPGRTLTVPADLTDLIASGLLTLCDPENKQELDRYTHYAALFRSDGESMCLALAESRGWAVATDDRKAIRVAKQTGLTVVSCPELVKAWAKALKPDQAAILQVLQDIQLLAQFRPNPSISEYKWWTDRLARTSP